MMHHRYKHEAVVSVDLGWSPENITRTAVAYWRPGEDPWWEERDPRASVDLLGLLAPFKEERTLVLLDIPIYGTEGLSKTEPFRLLDRALLGCGISLYPSYRAGAHGRALASAIEDVSGNFKVVESYPHPIHRFMWLAQDEPWCLEEELRPLEGTESWKKAWPPKYKRGSLPERRKNFSDLIAVLGRFLPGDYSSLIPGPENRGKDLDALGDIYDALVALRVGMEMARSSPWVLEAHVEGWDGMIPLLADANLRALWEDSVIRVVKNRR
jgi:predicted nuclease with RNAse H fold